MGLALVTERLELRAFEPSDLEALHAVNGDPELDTRDSDGAEHLVYTATAR